MIATWKFYRLTSKWKKKWKRIDNECRSNRVWFVQSKRNARNSQRNVKQLSFERGIHSDPNQLSRVNFFSLHFFIFLFLLETIHQDVCVVTWSLWISKWWIILQNQIKLNQVSWHRSYFLLLSFGTVHIWVHTHTFRVYIQLMFELHLFGSIAIFFFLLLLSSFHIDENIRFLLFANELRIIRSE